ncbi:hypothetical protein SDC9_04044 [bioreactor metagenome]|uniref:Uncharacterized protein n=1 Tax=bioreactor metagenome TaxID=1076179 RepID=A0A644SY00_9ZZZZ|nr:hypothetical protein [Negativicutes bacterium]
MKVSGGETLIVTLGNEERRWKVSAVDSRVVKLFEEDGKYRQMPYVNLEAMMSQGCVKVEKKPFPE